MHSPLLSKHLWHIKNKFCVEDILKWKIIKIVPNYKASDKIWLFSKE